MVKSIVDRLKDKLIELEKKQEHLFRYGDKEASRLFSEPDKELFEPMDADHLIELFTRDRHEYSREIETLKELISLIEYYNFK